jgi:N-acetylgalactosamine kinase
MAAKPVVELIPTLSSLEPVYGEGSQLDEARLRFARLGDRFEAVYGARPALFARSPGRCLFHLNREQFVSVCKRSRD